MLRYLAASGTAADYLGCGDQHESRIVVLVEFDSDDLHPLQAEHTCHIAGQARGPPGERSSFATRMVTERHGHLVSSKTLTYQTASTRFFSTIKF